VIPGAFDYHAPRSIEDALALLARFGEDAKLLAGGQSLIPAMRFRLAAPGVLIDINRVPGLGGIREDGGQLILGALTRESDLDESPLIQSRYPLLADTARVIADPLVRNLATVGGNIAHADPANDHPATLLAYGATVVTVSPRGQRNIAIDDFFTGLFETCLEADEILTEIRIPAPTAGSGGAYLKVERKVGDYATSGVAVNLVVAGGKITQARVGLTNVSPVPLRATGAEAALIGQAPTEEVLEAAGQAAAAESDPSPDLRGSVEYKRDLTRVLVKRAVKKAVARAQGGGA
jgi:carbon-monoxide dehydrogenase medium subunit